MRSVIPILACLLAVPAAAAAEETAGFVVLLGDDTLAVERITREASRIRGEYVIRSPRTSHRRYTADLAADGTIRRFEMTARNLGPGPGPAETRSTVEFAGDSAVTSGPRGDSTVTRTVAAGPGSIPVLQGVMGLMEQIARQARASGAPRYSARLVTPGSSQTSGGTLIPRGGDTLHFMLETTVGTFGPWIMRLDPAGRLLHYDGRGTPFAAVARRVPAPDVAAVAAAYADRPLGPLSARDTVRASLAGAELRIEYGRPERRGRTIFGGVVPWNQVWRTGANAATHLHTPVDLTIGGAAVPAGSYTLWTLPAPGGWKLILNRQTGQWGTVYDPAQDLVRVDLQVETLPEPVEAFTIAVEPASSSSRLTLSWDRTRASVPIARKQ